ncbi:MAG: M14 family metallopeptidase [Myxococcota bacterium]
MAAAHEPLAPYPSPEERDAELSALVELLDARLHRYGTSVEGRPLHAVRVACAGPRQKGQVLCVANLHGLEWVGNRVAVGLLRAVLDGEPEVARLLEDAALVVVPCANPDGYARVYRQGGRGNLRELRTNARGVDLNRNFPPPQGALLGSWPGAGSRRPGTRTYRGEAPLSEPESRALAAFLDENTFVGSVSLHSYMGTLITPRLPSRQEYGAYDELCAVFRAHQRRWRYRRFASRRFDTFTGELEDYQHHHHRTWATCVEVFPLLESWRQHRRAPSLFWRFNPRDPQLFVHNDVPAIIAFFRMCVERGPVP